MNAIMAPLEQRPSSALEIALLDFGSHVMCGANGQRHDGEGRVLLRRGCKTASVHHKQVLDFVSLAVGV
jgi:hypothetical protein